MKLNINTLISAAAAAIMALTAATAGAQTWNFTATGDADIANLAADPAAWEHEQTSSNDRYKSLTPYDRQPLTANGQELQVTAGLLFTAGDADAIRIDIKGKRMATNKPLTITIPGLKAGMTLTMSCKTSSKTTARGFNVTNLEPVEGSFNATSLDEQTNVATVVADGDVTLANTGGMYVYSIAVADPQQGGGDTPAAADHSVDMDLKANQARLTTTGGVEVLQHRRAKLHRHGPPGRHRDRNAALGPVAGRVHPQHSHHRLRQGAGRGRRLRGGRGRR